MVRSSFEKYKKTIARIQLPKDRCKTVLFESVRRKCSKNVAKQTSVKTKCAQKLDAFLGGGYRIEKGLSGIL